MLEMNLSRDVWSQILSYLKPQEILQVSRTCKMIYRARCVTRIKNIVRGQMKEDCHPSINQWIGIEGLMKLIVDTKNSFEKHKRSQSHLSDRLWEDIEFERRQPLHLISEDVKGVDKIIVGLQVALDLNQGGKIYIVVVPEYINGYHEIITKKFELKYCLAYHKNKQYSKIKFYAKNSLSEYDVVLFTRSTFATLRRYNPVQPGDTLIIDVPTYSSLSCLSGKHFGIYTITEIILSELVFPKRIEPNMGNFF